MIAVDVQLGAHPFFRSFMERAKVLGNNPVVEKVGNLKEGIRERWETTDNPTVQRFQVGRRLVCICSCALRQVSCDDAGKAVEHMGLQCKLC